MSEPPKKKRGRPPKVREPEVQMHPLDTAHRNSTLTIVRLEARKGDTKERKAAVLSDPCGYHYKAYGADFTRQSSVVLPETDPAYTLPVGAKIVKEGEGRFVSEQLDFVLDRAKTVHTKAMDAIEAFIGHFHGDK